MRVHVHTKFCFLCVLTFLFHQCNHCHAEGHSHQHGGHQHADHKHAHSDLQISEAPYMRGATISPKSMKHDEDALEEEQRFYIQQLFRRYGQKDQLDFQGFQSLLFSLGLGEVKMVDVGHEDLGHDHVAHLDLLDMQKGLHSHSSEHEGHGQGHGHGPHHKSSSHHPHTEQVPTACSKESTAASPAAGAPRGHEQKHDHDPDHDHGHDAEHSHDHTRVENRDHKHSDVHVQDTVDYNHDGHDHAHDRDHKHEQVQSNNKDLSFQPHSDHDHGDHEHDHVHQIQNGTDIPPLSQKQVLSDHLEPSQVPQELQSPPVPTESQLKKPRKPARFRGQRGRNKTLSTLTPPSDDHDHEHSHDHDHRHSHSHSRKDKREAPGGLSTPTLPVPLLAGHPGGLSHQHEEVRHS